MSETLTAPVTPTARAAAWLARLEAALAARDSAAAAALFDDECYWRDLVSFTWNLRTEEGRDAIREMLDAQLGTVAPSGVRIHAPLLDTPSLTHPGKFNLPGHHAQKVRKVSAAAALSRSAAAMAPGRRPARRAAPAPSSRAGRGPGGGSSPSPRSPGRRTAARASSASGR